MGVNQDLLRVVVAARPRQGHRVSLRFDDGVEGEVDLRDVIGRFTGLLAPLQEPSYVAQLRVDPLAGTITWPNGADLDPVVLYCAVRGIPVPDFGREKQARGTPKAKSRARRSASRSPKDRGRRAGA